MATEKNRRLEFYKNNHGVFEKLEPLINHTEETNQVNWVDYDNDGDKDLFVTAYQGPNRLYQNNGSLVLTDITESAGFPIENFLDFGAIWGDFGWMLYFGFLALFSG